MAGHPALLVMDLINEIVHPAGKYAAEGYAGQVAGREVLEHAATAISRARAAGVPVIHVVVGFQPDYSDWPPGSPVFAPARQEGRLILGTWATRPHDQVKPALDEPVVVKRRLSPFYGTELELLLRTRGVDTVLLAGVSTDLVVLSTAREAHDRDFQVVVLEDATAAATQETHQAAVRLLARTATVTTVDAALPA